MNSLLIFYIVIISAVLLVWLSIRVFKRLRWPYTVERKSGGTFTLNATTHDEALRIAETLAPSDVASVSFGNKG